jgi:2-polyprenyl-3-methyl-5-hydroxy-6-metoxy-1,4-benzoquinol methylase
MLFANNVGIIMKSTNPDNCLVAIEVISCPRCSSSNSNILFKGKDYLYHISGEYCASKCNDCGLWYQNPRPLSDQTVNLYPINYSPHTSSDQVLIQPKVSIGKARFLNEYYNYSINLTNVNDNGLNWRAWKIFDKYRKWSSIIDLMPRYIQEGKLLEIGCGNGNRLITLQHLGWLHLSGIELVSFAAKQAEKKGITIKYGQVEKELETFPDGFFDVIISSMVMEHLINPFTVFCQISRKLKPEGQFLFSTIVRDSFDALIFKQFWAGFDFPRHMIYFSKKDLKTFLKDDFCSIKCFNQIAPVDYFRSASWKISEGKGNFFDHAILFLSKIFLGKLICAFFAFIGYSTRVSYICQKDSDAKALKI